jgi:hypothetical protein
MKVGMHRLTLVCAGWLVALNANAADIDDILAGCNALTAPTKKMQCIKAAERLSGTASPPTAASKKGKSGSPSDLILKAQAEAASLLKDPESARFSSTAISPSTGAVCGLVNAKNALGGYAGPKRFIVTSEKALIEDADTWKMDLRWQELCSEF